MVSDAEGWAVVMLGPGAGRAGRHSDGHSDGLCLLQLGASPPQELLVVGRQHQRLVTVKLADEPAGVLKYRTNDDDDDDDDGWRTGIVPSAEEEEKEECIGYQAGVAKCGDSPPEEETGHVGTTRHTLMV